MSIARAELLALIRNDRLTLDEIVVALSDEVLRTPGPGGGWRVKDHLSHLAAWERMIVAHLTDGSDAAVAGMAPGEFVRASLDTINTHLYESHRHDLVAAVRAEFAAAHASTVAFIETLTETHLSEVYWKDDPSGRTVLEKISGDTYLHYREHAAWISGIVGPDSGQRNTTPAPLRRAARSRPPRTRPL